MAKRVDMVATLSSLPNAQAQILYFWMDSGVIGNNAIKMRGLF
jgi:hypothetical protein